MFTQALDSAHTLHNIGQMCFRPDWSFQSWDWDSEGRFTSLLFSGGFRLLWPSSFILFQQNVPIQCVCVCARLCLIFCNSLTQRLVSVALIYLLFWHTHTHTSKETKSLLSQTHEIRTARDAAKWHTSHQTFSHSDPVHKRPTCCLPA